MGKALALYLLLIAVNAVFLYWLWTRNKCSKSTSGRTDRARDSSFASEVSPDSVGVHRVDNEAEASATTGGVVVYRDMPPVREKTSAEQAAPASHAPAPHSSPAPTPGVPARPEAPFLVPPIVQIGSDASRLDCVEILFFTPPELHGFSVRAFSDRQLAVTELVQTPICVEKVPPHKRFTCTVSGLRPGEKFQYWVVFGGKVVFEAESRARIGRGTPHRFVVVGDTGNGSVESMRIAHRIHQYKPDLLAITGDVVYMHGRASEYLRRFLPVYNAPVSEAGVGAPLLSEVVSFTSLGNHCVGKTEWNTSPTIDEFPDLHAYFMYWSMPLNGPLLDPSADKNIPELIGDEERIKRFLKTAGNRFPQMGNYHFECGDAHWLVLDANAYMDWTMKELREWVEDALIAAQAARWRFVNFHQPGFSSNPKHGQEKRMRLLAELFQKYGVDVVFNGHCHYYERSYPLKFTVDVLPDGSVIDKDGYVGGEFALDKTFDGETKTRPNGVIYITTGAGGAKLDPSGIHWRKGDWKPFTHKLIGDRHSFTVCDLEESMLTIRQLDMSGKEIDRFVITK